MQIFTPEIILYSLTANFCEQVKLYIKQTDTFQIRKVSVLFIFKS